MPNTFFSYFKLFWLCLKLISNLAAFLVVVLFKKADQKKYTDLFLLILIVIMVGLNLFTLKERNTIKINYQEINSIKNLDQNLNFQKTLLPENKLTESLEFYQNLEKQRINSLGLYLNLIEINKANKNQDEINKYLEKAQLIDPKIIYLEN